MLKYTNLSFFSKRGNHLNLDRINNSVVEIHDGGGGFGAILQPLININGELKEIVIFDSGTNYNAGTTYLKVVDINGSIYEIDNGNLTIINGKIINVSITPSPTLPTGFTFPSILWKGDIYIPEKVSVGLIENEHIFIVEKINNKYYYPTDTEQIDSISYSEDEDFCIEMQFQDTNEYDTEAIFLFDVKNKNSTLPEVDKKEIQKQTLFNKNTHTKNAMQWNIGFFGLDEGVFERTLDIFYKKGLERWKIGEVLVHGEVEGEDVRLNTILDNIGNRINMEEEFIFRESDINEDLVDVKLLNRKRKEFILEHSNITPFIGSYKGFFNVLNWLGYNDLKIREYWKNINPSDEDFGEMIPLDIDRKNINKNTPTPSKIWKKTSRFSLVYKINQETGEYDKWNLPETEDVFMFTIEEVLIKLFALKKYLKERFLPLNARIYEITGEGVYFEKLRVNTWNNADHISNIDYTRDIDFTVNKNIVTIGDLRYE